jgi:hypothetical protein
MLGEHRRRYIEARTRVDTLFSTIDDTEGFPDHPGDHHVIAHRIGKRIDGAIRDLEVAAINLADAVAGGKPFVATMVEYNSDHPVREQSDPDDGPEDERLDGEPDAPDDDRDEEPDAYEMSEVYPTEGWRD